MQIKEFTAPASCELAEGYGNYGPRVVIRSIKAIQRGEEATITYIDLLQPTALRQSELLLKFQFICGCRRCRTMPQAYVDYALQETFLTYCHESYPKSLINYYRESAVARFRDVFDSTIMEYMEVGDPVSCCEKIEGLLSQAQLDITVVRIPERMYCVTVASSMLIRKIITLAVSPSLPFFHSFTTSSKYFVVLFC
uniref:[histone H3]-lysine(4) N-trimethyltransferase n=1 Tax=Opuntia streptacantha TaxID=393608 RepID=A0A7C9AGR0_OPUST